MKTMRILCLKTSTGMTNRVLDIQIGLAYRRGSPLQGGR